MRLNVDRTLCEGNGLCELAAPTVFMVDDDANLVVREDNVIEAARGSIELAVSDCPRQALSLD